MGDPEKFDSMDSVPGSGQQPIPSAVLLRRRFSAQRQANLSTSSSGTTGTGCLNTACSSTDSSMDASHVCSVPIGDARRWEFAISGVVDFVFNCLSTHQVVAFCYAHFYKWCF